MFLYVFHIIELQVESRKVKSPVVKVALLVIGEAKPPIGGLASCLESLFSGYYDRNEVGIGAGADIDAGFVRLGKEGSEPIEDPVVVALLDDDGGRGDRRIGLEEYDIFRSSFGEVDDRLLGDEGFRGDVFVRLFRQRDEVLGHIAEFGIEGGVLARMVRERNEVFGRVPERRGTEDEDDEKHEADFHAALRAVCLAEEEEERDRRHEEDEGLGADGSKRVREALIGQEFRHEHHEESGEQEGVRDELHVASAVPPPRAEKPDQEDDREDESGKEEDADERIEDGIWRIIVPPVHVADEIVFDQGEADRGSERPPEISSVHFRREDRDGGRSGGEDGRVRGEEIEHGSGRDSGAEHEDERVFPEAFEKRLVGEEEKREEQNQNERGEPEGDIGVESEPEKEAREREREKLSVSEPPEQEEERE